MMRDYLSDFFTAQWWRYTWVWIRFGGALHRCGCCNAYNRSVGYCPTKKLRWMCGECVYVCDGRCDGAPFRKLEKLR